MERLALRFSIAGIPVMIHATFWLLPFWISGFRIDERLAIAIPISLGAVLIHELGHALTARHNHVVPSIELVLFGGLTRFAGGPQLGRARSAAIIAAGPLVGAIPGLVLLAVTAVNGYPDDALAEDAVRLAIWMSVGLSLLNLLPIVPLDGGQLVATVMPGDDPERRLLLAKVVTIGVGAGVVVWLWSIDAQSRWIVGGIVLLAFFAVRVAGQLKELRGRGVQVDVTAAGQEMFDPALEEAATKHLVGVAADENVDVESRALAVQLIVSRSMLHGDAGSARRWMSVLGPVADPVFELAAVVIETAGDEGVDELSEAFAKLPNRGFGNRHLIGALLAVGRAEAALRSLQAAYTAPTDAARVLDSARSAALAGAPRLALALADYGLDRLGLPAQQALGLAAQLAGAGHTDEAAALVRRLVADHGVSAKAIGSDPRFASLASRLD